MQLNNSMPSYGKNYLPSKKIQYIILALIVAGVAIWGIPRIKYYYQTHRASFSITGKPPEPLISTAPTPTSLDRDTDGDGLSDWQENLFGFDPNKKDTDGDGEQDTLPIVDGSSIGTMINLPDTDKLMIAVYAKFQDTPTEDIKPEAVQEVISAEVLANAESIEAGFKRYKTIDLELVDTDKESVTKYQDQILSLLNGTTDLIILVKNIQDKILNDGDPSVEISTLNAVITKLLTVPVPTTISDVHLSVINAAYFIVQDLQIPSNKDSLTIYTKSIIAQKNINLVQKAVDDISTLASIYSTTQ
jgi:hypothetical protein